LHPQEYDVYKLFLVFAVCVVAWMASNAAGADEVVGAIWRVENNRGRVYRYRAGPKGVLWTTPKEGKPQKLGTWSGNPGETVMKIDAPDLGGIGTKRTITVTLVGKNPPKWQGEAETPDGKKTPLTITLVKD
jgi:hypothetical protein